MVTEENEFDFNDVSMSKNGRVSIPLSNLPPQLYYGKRVAKHPSYIIYLSCDVTGVLPHCVTLNRE
jgi:phosphoenolpyruvate carboxykinase (ATP)